MKKFLFLLVLGVLFSTIFGTDHSWMISALFAGMYFVISIILDSCNLIKKDIEPIQKPLSEEAKKYLSDRVENMQLKEAKKDTTYNGYTEQELKYMGLYKN